MSAPWPTAAFGSSTACAGGSQLVATAWTATTDWERRHLGGAWKGTGRWPDRHLAASRSNALDKTRRTPKTPRTVPAWSVSSQAIFWLASYSLDSKPFISAQAYLATVLIVLGVLSVLARPPENEIHCGRPAHSQWHFPWNAAVDWERRHLGGARLEIAPANVFAIRKL